jgi:Predicted acetyltransferase
MSRIQDAVSMQIQILRAEEGDRAVMRRLLELYQYDFSEFDSRDVDANGEYGYPCVDHYWTEASRHPFLFRVDGHWAGLALVRTGPPTDMAEFFVLRKYRRAGVGRRAAAEIFRLFPSEWTVRQQRRNAAATSFWRTAIPYAYRERETGDEVIQEFKVDPL